MDVRQAVKLLLVGFLIGIAFALPGVSGAVIAVVFGIYGRLVADLSDLRVGLKKDLWFIMLLGLGLAAGFVMFAVIFTDAVEAHGSIIMLLFLGLIVGQVPEVCKIAKGDQPVRPSYVAWAAVGVIAMLLLLVATGGEVSDVTLDRTIIGIMLAFCAGVILAVSGIIPGISGTSLLIAIGLFTPTMYIVRDFDPVLMLPLLAGAFIGMVFIANVMNRLLTTRYYETYYVVLGLTIGSVILILPQIDASVNIMLGIAAFIVGLAVSTAFNLFGRNQDLGV
jgi:Predicted membrane protein